MARTIKLPAGHIWDGVNVDATHDDFECRKCGATFSVDLMEGTRIFEDGDGECDTED